MINKKRLLNTFIDLVKIDSPSGQEEKIRDHIVEILTKLNGDIYKDGYGNLIAKFAGTGTPILLNAHLDTVEPGRGVKPKIHKNKITSDGTTILGGDAKAGISIILEALTCTVKDKIKTRPIEILLTREEETSLGGAKNLDYSLLNATEGIVFDGDEQVFKLFISSPTYYNLDVDITGRSAHAGVEPEKGISAIEIASKIISGLSLGRLDHETTFNIGFIQGGSVRNAVPDKTAFHGEIRSRNKKTLNKILIQTEKLFNEFQKLYPESQIYLNLTKEFEGFLLNYDDKVLTKVSEVMKKMGMEPELKDSGGGSDANIFYENGIQVLIVGTGVYEPHTTREYVKIDEMTQAAEFCLEFIKK